jgi:hypothetical protein
LAEEENSHGRIPDSLEERFHPEDAKKRKVSRKDAKKKKGFAGSSFWFLVPD